VAKGRGFVAARIREEAQKHRVPIVEDPPLARTLEKLCKLGQPIPEALYRAVAEVFAYVMGRRRGPYRPHLDLESPQEARP
jgi:flagellar biosynthetic protein FlhB